DRADRARRQDHLAAATGRASACVLPPAHADGAAAGELDRLDQAAGLDPQVGTPKYGLEEGARRRPAPPALLIDVKGATAFIVAAVEIRDRLHAGLLGGSAEIIENVPAHPRRLDAQLSADAVAIA